MGSERQGLLEVLQEWRALTLGQPSKLAIVSHFSLSEVRKGTLPFGMLYSYLSYTHVITGKDVNIQVSPRNGCADTFYT